MWVAVFFRVFHVALSPLLIFGVWIFPRLGVTGAAVTNVFSQGLGAAIGLWFMFSGRTRLRLTLRDFHFDASIIWRMVKIGFPASITGMGRTLSNLLIMWFLTPFGTLAVAAHTLNQRVEMFVNTPQMAYGQAAGVLAGQNLGAKQPERAERTGWLASALLSVMMLVLSGAIFIWAEPIIRIFNSKPDLVALSSTFLRIACAGWLVLGLTSVFQQCLNGVGDTLVPMVIMMINFWLLQIALAFVFTRYTGFGVYGVRWAIVIGTATASIAYTVYFKMGLWKNKQI
jgi:putative MATE family efflux protein